MLVSVRYAIAVLASLFVATAGQSAEPRDEALRLAPRDAALILVVQNAREHVRSVFQSPFAEWLPDSTLGKQLLGVGGVKSLFGGIGPILTELGTTPDEVLNDVLGDAVVFAYTPATTAKPNDERAVFLIRPRKPETLKRLVDRINEVQTQSKELNGVVPRTHNNEPYFERKKAGGQSEFYCYRASVFAFSSNETEIKAVIDRDKAANGDAPEYTSKMKRLGVDHAAAVLLIQPRTLDEELTARIASTKADERAILEKFRDVWMATEDIAVYLAFDRDVESGVSVRFDSAKLPPWARGWLTGAKQPSALWSIIPEDAILAVAGRFKAAELLELIQAVLPEDGRKTFAAVVTDSLGPVVGKDKLPLVLNALGPDWAIWAEPPRGDGALPVIVAAVRVDGDGTNGAVAKKSILQGVEFGFQTFRVLYNRTHTDQVELQESMDGAVTITTLVNDKAFPRGFRPSFALKGGYLVIAGNPDAIRRFKSPTGKVTTTDDTLVARFSGTSTRAYLQSHGPKLARLLSGFGHGDDKELAALMNQLVVILEPIDRAEVFVRGDDSSMRVAVRVKLIKPLKK